MSKFTSAERRKALFILVFIHLIIIAISNYLVQIPVLAFGFHTTWGAVTFPLIFLATDLTARIYGPSMARRIIFGAMLPGLAISYIFSVMFYEGVFQGFAGFAELNTFVARIAVASFIAYVAGQLLDVGVFRRLRQQQQWWIAPAFSTVIGGAVDTLLFFSIAFYQSTDEFMASHWQEIALVDYGFKLTISLLLFVPAYGILMNSFSAKMREKFA